MAAAEAKTIFNAELISLGRIHGQRELSLLE